MSDPTALGAWRRRARGGPSEHRRAAPMAMVAVGTIALACLVAGRAHQAPHRPPAPTPALTPAPALCPPIATPLQDPNAMHTDVDGDGCDEEVSFAGGVLTAGRIAMRVGEPEDEIALGRWTCGPVTLALLRPATGEIFRFDGWATPDNPMRAIALGRVDGAIGLRAVARENGRCDDIVVTRTTGPAVLLPGRPVAG